MLVAAEVGLRDDAAQFSRLIDHEDATDALVRHDPGDVSHARLRAHRHHRAAHELVCTHCHVPPAGDRDLFSRSPRFLAPGQAFHFTSWFTARRAGCQGLASGQSREF